MKKRSLWLSVALALLLSLCACSSGTDTDVNDVDDNDDVVVYDDNEFSGWWVLTEESKNEGGIPLVSIIQIFPEDGVYYSYDQFGVAGDAMECVVDNGTITLDLDFTQADFVLDGDFLVNPETGTPEFVNVDDPGFLQTPGYDGKWAKVSNKDYAEFFIFNGNTYTHATTYDGETWNETEPAEWTPGNFECFFGTGESVKNVPTINLNFPDPTFYVDETGTLAYVEDMFDYVVYVHESVQDEAFISKAVNKATLMSTKFQTMPFDDGSFLYLRLLPYGFEIMTYDNTGNRIDTPYGEGSWSGTWDLDDAGDLVLTGSDGQVYYGSHDFTTVKLDMIDATFYGED